MPVFGLIALLLTASCAHPVAAVPPQGLPPIDPFIATIENMKSSIAPVICRGKDANGVLTATIQRVMGSAFFTSDKGEFVTAAHVLTAMKNVKGGCAPAIYVPRDGWRTDATTFNVRFYDFGLCPAVNERLDVAVCKTINDMSLDVSRGVKVVPVTLSTVRQPDGTPVAFSGFPLQANQPLTSRGFIAAYRGGVNLPQAEVVVDKNGWPGVSGGPLYLADGAVIGVVLQRGVGDGAGITVARPTVFIDAVRKAQQPQGQDRY